MPNNALYWWGYLDSNCEVMIPANGWSNGNSWTMDNPTYNKNSVSFNAVSSHIGGLVSKTTISSDKTVKCLIKMTSNTDFGGMLGSVTSKTYTVGATIPDYMTTFSNTALALVTKTAQNNSYVIAETHNERAYEMNALWYE
jgi:hypothetical protein